MAGGFVCVERYARCQAQRVKGLSPVFPIFRQGYTTQAIRHAIRFDTLQATVRRE